MVRLPESLRASRPGDAEGAVQEASCGLKICASNADGTHRTVWPQAPGEWATASLPTLVDLFEVAGLSERKVAESLDMMETAVRSTAAMLRADEEGYPDQGRKIGAALHQKEGERT